ncbi:MAG: CDP-glycerol glycerophosphotransferase family protein [Aquabacterium sp.]
MDLTLPDEVHGTAALLQRLEQVEAFGGQVSSAIDQLVQAVVDLQQAAPTPKPVAPDSAVLDSLHKEVEGLRSKVRELDQQLQVERAGRDLAQVSRMHPKARIVVCVGTLYFGDNAKYAWIALREQAAALGFQLWWLPYNADQQALVAGLGGAVFPASHAQWSPQHLHTALSAAVVITSDHFLNPNPFAAALLAGARQVQLWHGVSIKEIGLRNLPPGRALGPHLGRVLATCGPYARLVGTAAAAQAEWRRWFAFQRYAPIGYPRNDVLYREPAAADIAGADAAALERAAATVARGRRVVLYAPTFRDGRPDWLAEVGVDQLAQACTQRGDLLVVNLHPVEQGRAAQWAQRWPAVLFTAPRTDVYPLLRLTAALVTDYSSLMFDYLHLDRPVLLYRPDHAAYVQRSRALFDAKLATPPGPLFTDAAALARALRRDDLGGDAAHAAARAALRAQWYDHHDGASGQRLAALVTEELALAGAEET